MVRDFSGCDLSEQKKCIFVTRIFFGLCRFVDRNISRTLDLPTKTRGSSVPGLCNVRFADANFVCCADVLYDVQYSGLWMWLGDLWMDCLLSRANLVAMWALKSKEHNAARF